MTASLQPLGGRTPARPGPGPIPDASCARSTSRSAAAWRACSPATTARRSLGDGTRARTDPPVRARRRRPPDRLERHGADRRAARPRRTWPSACSSPGSCSTPRRRCASAPPTGGRPTSRRASRSPSATSRRGAATGWRASPSAATSRARSRAPGPARPVGLLGALCARSPSRAGRIGATSLGDGAPPRRRARARSARSSSSSRTSAARATGASRCSSSPAGTTWSPSRSATRASRSCRTPASSGSSIRRPAASSASTRAARSSAPLRRRRRGRAARRRPRARRRRRPPRRPLHRPATGSAPWPLPAKGQMTFSSPLALLGCSRSRCWWSVYLLLTSGGGERYAERWTTPGLLPNLVDRFARTAPATSRSRSCSSRSRRCSSASPGRTRPSASSARRRPSCSRSTPRGRWARPTCSRRVCAPPQNAAPSSSTCAVEVPRRDRRPSATLAQLALAADAPIAPLVREAIGCLHPARARRSATR